MCKEARSLATLEPASNEYVKLVGAIETAETLETVATRMRSLNSAQFALVTIVLEFGQNEKMGSSPLLLANRSTQYYLEHLRSQVRRTDNVLLLHHTLYFILAGANLQGGEIVQERLWDTLLWHINSTLEGDYLRPSKITIGHSACLVPFVDVYQCINRASEAKRSFDLQPEQSGSRTDGERDAELLELAHRMGVPYVACLPRKLPTRIQRLIDPMLAQELQCFPIGRNRDILTVAMCNPQDRRVLDRLHKATGLNIFPVLTHPCELQMVLKEFL